MLSQDMTVQPQPAPSDTGTEAANPQMPLELLELELSIEGFEGGEQGFREAVRQAACAAAGEFLFDLPAEGLLEDCRRLAVIRVPDDEEGMRVMLAILAGDGTEIRLQQPDEETAHLARFADAFVDVLQRMPEQARDAA